MNSKRKQNTENNTFIESNGSLLRSLSFKSKLELVHINNVHKSSSLCQSTPGCKNGLAMLIYINICIEGQVILSIKTWFRKRVSTSYRNDNCNI